MHGELTKEVTDQESVPARFPSQFTAPVEQMNTQLQRGFRTSITPNNNLGVWVLLLHAAVVHRFILPPVLKMLNIWKFDLGIKARK